MHAQPAPHKVLYKGITLLLLGLLGLGYTAMLGAVLAKKLYLKKPQQTLVGNMSVKCYERFAVTDLKEHQRFFIKDGYDLYGRPTRQYCVGPAT